MLDLVFDLMHESISCARIWLLKSLYRTYALGIASPQRYELWIKIIKIMKFIKIIVIDLLLEPPVPSIPKKFKILKDILLHPLITLLLLLY